MKSFSSFCNQHAAIVPDTSVLINLHACQHGDRILTALPNRILVAQQVANELRHETSVKNGQHNFFDKLLDAGTVLLTELSDEEYILFEQLISNSPSLDDGEAATIAIAFSRKLIPVIDEKKGRARAAALMPSIVIGWSLDLLRHPNVISKLGQPMSTEALFLALREGRMRIPSEVVDDVIDLIGEERSRLCTCLPGYRERFGAQLV